MFFFDYKQSTSKSPRKTTSSVIILLVLALTVSGCQPGTPLIVEADTPTVTLPIIRQAQQVLDEYYTALVNRDYTKAAYLFTTTIGITRSELIQIWEDNDDKGWRLTGYEITNQTQYDEKRIVFWVRVTQEGGEPSQYNTINVVHLEDGGWFVGDLTLDKNAIQGRPRSKNDVTVVVGVLFRYVEGYAVWFNVNNDSANTIIWG